MLNPALKLNEKLFDKEVEQKSTREGFGEGLLEAGSANVNVVALSADVTGSTKTDTFARAFPDRFFQCGVAEQDMAAIAAGFGVSGKIAFISSYATFSPGKNWETIRTTIVYNHSNVKIAGHHTGIVTGADGATHQATEDIAIMRALPGIDVVVPCDSIEAKKAVLASVDVEGPMYLRFTRDKTPIMTTDKTPFELGKVYEFWKVDSPQVVIFATGHLLYQALVAAKELAREKIAVSVVNVATVKPLDVSGIVNAAKMAGAVVTVEDHQILGGLGGAISELLAKEYPLPIEFIGLRDTFAESGKPAELIEKYHMDSKAIKIAVKKVIKRKSYK